MANHRLREAMHSAQLTPRQVAEDLEVDPKTVERWITQARTPYPRHRHRLAAALGESESYLWPDAITDEWRQDASRSEIVQVFPHRSNVPLDLWDKLLLGAERRIDILTLAGLFLPEQFPDLVTQLQRKGGAGVQVRLLLGDPGCDAVATRGREEGIGDAVASRIQNVLSHYAPLAGCPGIDLRLHRTTLYASIYQFDEDLLVNTHVQGLPGAHAPVFHLRPIGAGDLFETYIMCFERVWQNSTPALGA